jgi:hypothetical protein
MFFDMRWRRYCKCVNVRSAFLKYNYNSAMDLICIKSTWRFMQKGTPMKLEHPFIYSFIHSFIHPFIYSFIPVLMAGPLSLPNRVSHTVRSDTSCFNFQYSLVFLRPYSICLHLLPRIPVTYIHSSSFSSMVCFRRQFIRKMWPMQVSYHLFSVCSMFLSSLTPCNTS